MFNCPLVYVVLVNYKNWYDTIECLNSLFHLSYANFKVIVVDNHSQDDSIEQIKNWPKSKYSLPKTEILYQQNIVSSASSQPLVSSQVINSSKLDDAVPDHHNLILVESDKNLGFAGGNNIGIKLALKNKADYVWFLNNDTVVEHNTLCHLVNHSESENSLIKKLGIIGSKLLYYHNPNNIQALLGRYRPITATTEHIGLNNKDSLDSEIVSINQNDYIVGASMFVSAEFIKEVGFMSEEYFLYFEELDWVKRGQKYGYTIDVCKKSRVYHKEGASIGGSIKHNNNKSELSDIYSIRNRIIITRKYYTLYLPTVYFSLIFVIINRIKRRQFRRLPLIFKIVLESFKSRKVGIFR